MKVMEYDTKTEDWKVKVSEDRRLDCYCIKKAPLLGGFLFYPNLLNSTGIEIMVPCGCLSID